MLLDSHNPPVCDWCCTVDLLETPRKEPSQKKAASCSHVPPDKSDDLFILCVPLTTDKHQRWRNASFKKATEDTSNNQSGIVCAGSRAAGSASPAKEAKSQPFSHRHPLQEVDWKIEFSLSSYQ